MPDVRTIYLTKRIKWVQRYLKEDNHNWKHICNWQLKKLGGSDIFENGAINIEAVNSIEMMGFYKSLVTSWAQFYQTNVTEENVLNQNLFQSEYLRANDLSFQNAYSN